MWSITPAWGCYIYTATKGLEARKECSLQGFPISSLIRRAGHYCSMAFGKVKRDEMTVWYAWGPENSWMRKGETVRDIPSLNSSSILKDGKHFL